MLTYAAIAEHSMCHPGLPSPHGEFHFGSPSLLFFHNAKSCGDRLRISEVELSDPSPSANSFGSPTSLMKINENQCSQVIPAVGDSLA